MDLEKVGLADHLDVLAVPAVLLPAVLLIVVFSDDHIKFDAPDYMLLGKYF